MRDKRSYGERYAGLHAGTEKYWIGTAGKVSRRVKLLAPKHVTLNGFYMRSSIALYMRDTELLFDAFRIM